MCQALLEIMEPHLLLREKEGMEEGRKDTEIKKAIMQRYTLSEEEAEGYL